MTSRRQLLRALGLGGAGFLAGGYAGPGREAQARRGRHRPADPPRRIVFFVSAHGTVWDQWAMRSPGGGLDQPWSYDLGALAPDQFSTILAPLHAHRQRMLLLDGVAIATVGAPKIATGPNEHERGHCSVLTGSRPRLVSGSLAQSHSASIDQLIASGMAKKARDGGEGSGPLYPSLELGGKLWSEVSYDSQGTPLPRVDDLRATFQRLFPSKARRRPSHSATSILDLVAGRYERLTPKLGFDDRLKLERHFSLVRDLERRLEFQSQVDCGEVEDPGDGPAIDSVERPAWHADGMLRMAALALSCDLTRVITWQDEGPDMNVLGFPGGDLHQEGAHAVKTNAAARQVMIAYHSWHARRLALFLDQLAATPDGDATLLDHTLVVWLNELGDGTHAWDRMPVALFGGGADFRMGRYLHWPQNDVVQAMDAVPIGPVHNRLLVSLARQQGLDLDSVGELYLPRAGGGSIDCRGELDRLI